MSTSNQLNWILYIVTNEQLVTNCDKSVILCFVTRINTESIKIQFWWQKSNFRRQKLNFRWRNGDFKFIWSFLVSGRGWNQGSMERQVRSQAGPRFLKFFRSWSCPVLGPGPNCSVLIHGSLAEIKLCFFCPILPFCTFDILWPTSPFPPTSLKILYFLSVSVFRWI